MDTIKRVYAKDRGHFTQHFEFVTYSLIFDKKYLETPESDSKTLPKLVKWLNKAFTEGPGRTDDSWESASSAGHPKPQDVVEVKTEFTAYAAAANYEFRRQEQHPIVQKHFLKNDVKTIATEMPLWLDAEHTPNAKGWHGSVDIVRIVGDTVQLLDFKPDLQERAHSRIGPQLYRYMFMLNKCAGIPLKNIEGYFFNNKKTYKITI